MACLTWDKTFALQSDLRPTGHSGQRDSSATQAHEDHLLASPPRATQPWTLAAPRAACRLGPCTPYSSKTQTGVTKICRWWGEEAGEGGSIFPNLSTGVDNPKYPVIGAGRHTKAKRQVPGRVSLRLYICLSLSKLINPLGFSSVELPVFIYWSKWQAGFFFPSPFPPIHPGVNISPYLLARHQPVCLFAVSLNKLVFTATDNKCKQL